MYTLDPEQAIAKGGEKLIFIHPEYQGQLIKVISPKYIDFMNNTRPILTKVRRMSYYWFYMRELTEFVYARDAKLSNKHFIQNITGLTDTNLGLGMCVEAVRKKNGELADTLGQIIKNGEYSDTHDKALRELMDWLDDTYIIIRDLTAYNMVWNEIGEHFVIIDGLGARHLPSLRSISQTYNRRGNRKRVAKLKERVTKQLAKSQHKLTRSSLVTISSV